MRCAAGGGVKRTWGVVPWGWVWRWCLNPHPRCQPCVGWGGEGVEAVLEAAVSSRESVLHRAPLCPLLCCSSTVQAHPPDCWRLALPLFVRRRGCVRALWVRCAAQAGAPASCKSGRERPRLDRHQVRPLTCRVHRERGRRRGRGGRGGRRQAACAPWLSVQRGGRCARV